MVRYQASEVAKLFNLPDYTYPVFGMALGCQIRIILLNHAFLWKLLYLRKAIKCRLLRVIEAFDQVQTAYAGARATDT